MWIKICGTTSLADARLAAEAGADAVGFVFAAASKRRVTSAETGAITAVLRAEFPAVERIGVFESLAAEEIVTDARVAGLTGVQLHGGGGVTLALAVRERAPELHLLPVVPWEIGAPGAAEQAQAEIAAFQAVGLRRVLLDSKVGAAKGGTGVAFSWTEAAAALADTRAGLQMVVAGGLRQETVAEAIRILEPWGVDVASGVEARAREKDPAAVRAFVRAARAAAAENVPG